MREGEGLPSELVGEQPGKACRADQGSVYLVAVVVVIIIVVGFVVLSKEIRSSAENIENKEIPWCLLTGGLLVLAAGILSTYHGSESGQNLLETNDNARSSIFLRFYAIRT